MILGASNKKAHLAKFTSQCLSISSKVLPYLTTGAVLAPVSGGSSLIIALGAAGIAVADLYIGLDSEEKSTESSELLTTITEILSSQSALASTTHAEILHLKKHLHAAQLNSNHTQQVAEKHQPILSLVQTRPSLIPQLLNLLEKASTLILDQSAVQDSAILKNDRANTNALLSIIESLPEKVFEESKVQFSDLKDSIKSDLEDLNESLDSLHSKVDMVLAELQKMKQESTQAQSSLSDFSQEEIEIELSVRLNLTLQDLRRIIATSHHAEDLLLSAKSCLLKGALTEADQKFQEIIDTEEVLINRLIQAHSGIANIAEDRNDYSQALEHYNKINKLVTVDKSPLDWALSKIAAANSLRELGDYSVAEQEFFAAFEMLSQIPTVNDSDIAYAYDRFGEHLKETNQLRESEDFLRRALQISRSINPAGSAEIAHPANTLATVLYLRNNFEEAEKLYRESIALLDSTSPLRIETRISVYSNLGLLLIASGRNEEAERLIDEAIELVRKIKPSGSRYLALALSTKARIFLNTARDKEARELMEEAVKIAKIYFKPDHPTFGTFLGNLGFSYFSVGAYEEAEPLLRESLEIARGSLPAYHPHISAALNNLAQLLEATNRIQEAESLLRKSVYIFLIFHLENKIEHTKQRKALQNYIINLRKQNLNTEQMGEKLGSLGMDAGWDKEQWGEWLKSFFQELATPNATNPQGSTRA